MRASRRVSRILSWTIIYLGPPLPNGLMRPTRDVADGPSCPCSVLLLTRFAEPRRSLDVLVGSYPTVSPLPVSIPHGAFTTIGGLLSVALSVGSPRLGVTQRHALWSPDFPRRRCRRDRLPGSHAQVRPQTLMTTEGFQAPAAVTASCSTELHGCQDPFVGGQPRFVRRIAGGAENHGDRCLETLMGDPDPILRTWVQGLPLCAIEQDTERVPRQALDVGELQVDSDCRDATEGRVGAVACNDPVGEVVEPSAEVVRRPAFSLESAPAISPSPPGSFFGLIDSTSTESALARMGSAS